MIRNLKVLGLVLGAVFAFSAAAASTASAVDTLTTAGQQNAIITATSHDHKFEITSTKTQVKCTTSVFSATAKNGASTITVEPTYFGTEKTTPAHAANEDCNASAPASWAIVDMNGCDYELTGHTTGKGVGTDATVWVKCPVGKEITITTNVGCTIHIHEQTPTEGGVTYINETDAGGKKVVKIKVTATGITYSAPAFACALGGIPSESNNSDYTGTAIAACFEDLKGTNHLTFVEGKQIDCEMSTS
jgi:hypothetical protein